RVHNDGAMYYGPFYPATAMRETLKLTRQLFPLRTCSITIDGTLERPCIQYAIHRCNAPCTGWETREGYAQTVRDVVQFLEGRDEALALRLTHAMEAAGAEMKFERAAVLRNQIQALNKVRERQKIISTDEVDQDVIGVVRQGSDACVEFFFVRKGRLLGQEAFFFDKVAGWGAGEILSAFVRQFYRKAVTPAPEILVSEELPEAELTTEWLSTLAGRRVQLLVPQRGAKREFVAMAEVNAAIALQKHLPDGVERRSPPASAGGTPRPEPAPTHCGRDHLNVPPTVLQRLGRDYLSVVALAKQHKEVYVGESFQPLVLDPTSPALHTLQKVRDE